MKKNKTICIIDDEEINQFIIKTIIKNLNCEINILTYTNGEKALESLKKSAVNNEDLPDIILLDINMPVLDGWQFLDEFVTIIPKIVNKMAIYILSSSEAPDDINKAKTYKEITGYLSRPITVETLKKIFDFDSIITNSKD